jgi:dTMP kinase
MASSAPGRGLLIVFEGVDGAGKTYNARQVGYMLRDKFCDETLVISFPDRTCASTGEIINAYLRKEITMTNRAAHLLFSANRWENVDYILRMLNLGIDVVLDRYFFSGIAYTMARGGIDDIGWILQADSGLPMPDLLFFLDAPKEMQQNVDGFGDEIHDEPTMQDKIRESFHHILTGLCIGTQNYSCKIHCLGGNADMDREELTKSILDIAFKFADDDSNREKPIEYFKYHSDEL